MPTAHRRSGRGPPERTRSAGADEVVGVTQADTRLRPETVAFIAVAAPRPVLAAYFTTRPHARFEL